jgi:hypothetical protein
MTDVPPGPPPSPYRAALPSLPGPPGVPAPSGTPGARSGPLPGGGPDGPSAAGRRLTWRRLAVLSVAVTLVALLGGGAGGYILVHNARKSSDRANCGRAQCIPGLKGKALLTVLTKQGFACADGDSGPACTLRTGETEYELHLDIRAELIQGYSVTVSSPDGREVSETKRNFLVWFAALPFSGDPTLVSEIEQWLVPRLTGGENVTAKIGGYRYDLQAERTRSLRLYVLAEYS